MQKTGGGCFFFFRYEDTTAKVLTGGVCFFFVRSKDATARVLNRRRSRSGNTHGVLRKPRKIPDVAHLSSFSRRILRTVEMKRNEASAQPGGAS